MNVFDLLFWALAFRLAVGLLDGDDERRWLAFGALAGFGLLNKISLLFLGFGLVVGLVAARRFEAFRSRYFWLGGGLAGLLFAPHLVWQRAHGWPTLEFMENASRTKNVVARHRSPSWRKQLLQTGPFHAVVWLAGLAAVLFAARLRPWRTVGIAYFADPRRDALDGREAVLSGTGLPGTVGRRRGGDRGLDGFLTRGAVRASLLAGASVASSFSPVSPSLRSRARSCRSTTTCVTLAPLVTSPGPTSARARPAAAVFRRHAGVARARRGGGSGDLAPPGGRTAASLRLRPELRRGRARWSTSGPSSACRRRSRRTTAGILWGPGELHAASHGGASAIDAPSAWRSFSNRSNSVRRSIAGTACLMKTRFRCGSSAARAPICARSGPGSSTSTELGTRDPISFQAG